LHQGLDLKLTPYRVIATSPSTGMVERVEGNPLSRVLADHSRDIKAFFRHHHPDRTGPYGVKASVMDNYVKSTAGYCVVTYLLGVGLSASPRLSLSLSPAALSLSLPPAAHSLSVSCLPLSLCRMSHTHSLSVSCLPLALCLMPPACSLPDAYVLGCYMV
jgi:hypothetical protein